MPSKEDVDRIAGSWHRSSRQGLGGRQQTYSSVYTPPPPPSPHPTPYRATHPPTTTCISHLHHPPTQPTHSHLIQAPVNTLGDQRTSKFQLPPAGSSHMMVPCSPPPVTHTPTLDTRPRTPSEVCHQSVPNPSRRTAGTQGPAGKGACRVRIPAERAVVLAAGEEHAVVVRAPGQAQDPSRVAQQRLAAARASGTARPVPAGAPRLPWRASARCAGPTSAGSASCRRPTPQSPAPTPGPASEIRTGADSDRRPRRGSLHVRCRIGRLTADGHLRGDIGVPRQAGPRRPRGRVGEADDGPLLPQVPHLRGPAVTPRARLRVRLESKHPPPTCRCFLSTRGCAPLWGSTRHT